MTNHAIGAGQRQRQEGWSLDDLAVNRVDRYANVVAALIGGPLAWIIPEQADPAQVRAATQ